MLTNVISSFRLRKCKVLKLISWKHSFKRLNEEYEIAKKKKQALDNLFETGRISQATRDSFDNDINAVIMEIEKQQKDLLMKMQGKAQELESQIKTLETLLANYEIQHVVGEIDEEIYQREINLLSTGLEGARHELDRIKEATAQISPLVEETTTEPSLPAEDFEVEVAQNEDVENVSEAPEEVEGTTEPAQEELTIETAEIMPEETPQTVEETLEVIEDQPEITEEMPHPIEEETPQITESEPQVLEDTPQEVEDQPQVTEEPLQSIDETPEVTEDTPEVTEELSQNVEETAEVIEDQPEITEEMEQPVEETAEEMENEPQVVEDTPLTEEAPQEAPQEIGVEVIEEEQSSEEESTATETDEDAEYHEL